MIDHIVSYHLTVNEELDTSVWSAFPGHVWTGAFGGGKTLASSVVRLGWGAVPQGGVASFAVVEHLDIFHQRKLCSNSIVGEHSQPGCDEAIEELVGRLDPVECVHGPLR